MIPDSGKKTDKAYGISLFFIRSAIRLTASLNVNLFYVSFKLTSTRSFFKRSWSYSLALSYDLRELSTPAFFIEEKSYCLRSVSLPAGALLELIRLLFSKLLE